MKTAVSKSGNSRKDLVAKLIKRSEEHTSELRHIPLSRMPSSA